MAPLHKRKSRLVFETSDCVRERGKLREVFVEADPYTASIRLKGLQQRFDISWAAVYNLAVKIAVQKAREEKLAKKKSKT